MRGTDEAAGSLFSYADREERIPARHPLRLIRRIVHDALARLDAPRPGPLPAFLRRVLTAVGGGAVRLPRWWVRPWSWPGRRSACLAWWRRLRPG